LAEKLGTQNLAEFYADVMLADQSMLANWLVPIIEANQQPYKNGELALDNPDYWVLYTMEAMAISPEKLDAGLVCFYLFNIVHLKEGEGIFQDAGIPHAYLRGQNVELMACSDNVIRGGLTPKYVDIVELLKIVDCREVTPKIISVTPQNQSEFTYKTPVNDFALAQIRVEPEMHTKVNLQSAGILLVMQGELKIQEKSTALTLKQGESAFITADSNVEIMSEKGGYAFLAKLP
jgi:phosphomannose isomerase type I